jgi:Fanconi anemia group M protein
LRDSVKNIVKKLKTSNSEIIKPARFVGQATKSKDDKGLSQKNQLEILEQFKQGQCNILVSTNVGEEGLDIAECDLVIFYDVVASEIRFIQRKGRTARHREGKVIILYCKDTHDEIYMHIALSKLSKMNVNLKSGQQLRTSYTKAPKEMIIEESPIEEPPSELPRKIETHQKQGNLQVFLQDSPSLPEKKTKDSRNKDKPIAPR